MSNTSSQACFTGVTSTGRIRIHVKRLTGLLVLALLLGVGQARAEGPDEEYLQIRGLIQQADDLSKGGKAAPATAKYQEAKAALTTFKQNYPDWNVKLVSFRLNYVVQKVAALSEPPSAAPGGEIAAATQPSTSLVKLLEPGTEPRQVLRLHPKPGDKQTLAMTMKLGMATKIGEMEPPAMKLPAIKMTLETTVKGVGENGDITYEMVISDTGISDEPGVTPEIAEAMKSAFVGIKGLSGSGTTSSRGVSKGLEFKAPADSNPQARQFVDQMKEFYTQLAVPVPEEAVGPGARWEVKMPIKTQGMTIDQTAAYEVVSLEGENLTTKSTIAQQAANQKIQNPAMPGMKVDLTKMTGKGTSQRTFALANLLPTAGTGVVHTEAAMAINMGGQKQAMTMKMDVNVQFEAK
jgi:hypothetical protein